MQPYVAANPSEYEGSTQSAGQPEVEAGAKCTIGFWLLILLTGVLFIRPAEIFPALEGMPIFNFVICACIIASVPAVLPQLSWSRLRAQPATLFVVALLPAIILSQLVRGNLFIAREAATEFLKVEIFYLLLTGLVNTPARLNRFIVATLVFIVAIASIAVLSQLGYIEVRGISVSDRAIAVDEATGEAETVGQLYGPGIFNDPNDFSLILAAAMLILVHCAIESRGWPSRLGFLALFIVPGYAFALTNSRGGFLSFAAGIAALGVSRFGLKRSLPLLAIALPVLLIVFGGRMTNINLDENDTAQGRVEIWREGFALLVHAPVLGIGYGNYTEEVGHVAHNSFVHAFTELGLVGGVIFTAAFYIPLSVLRLKLAPPPILPSELNSVSRWRAALLAVLIGYSIGLCSLSRVYTISTYLILGLAGAYCSTMWAVRPGGLPELSMALIKRVIYVGLACLTLFYGLARAFA